MSWFDAAGFASFAKNALTTAQKTLDKALDMKDIPPEMAVGISDVDFFETYGVATAIAPVSSMKNVPTSSENNAPASTVQNTPGSKLKETPKPAKPTDFSQNSNYWTDTWGSFFETKAPVPEIRASTSSEFTEANTSPKKAKSMDAVSSQPQRAGLFPSDSRIGQINLEVESGDSVPGKQGSVSQIIEEEEPVKEEDNVAVSSDSVRSCSENISDDGDSSTLQSRKILLGTTVKFLAAASESQVIDISIPFDRNDDIAPFEDEKEKNSAAFENVIVNDNLCSDNNDKVSPDICFSEATDSSQSHDCDFNVTGEQTNTIENANALAELKEESSKENLSDSCVSQDLMKDNFAGSFVNLESKDTDSKTDRSESPNGESENESRNFRNYDDSFHIIGSSVLVEQCTWGVIQSDSHIDDANRDSSPDDQNSATGDSGSTTSKEDEMEIRECDMKSVGSGGSQEISNSYVKCSIEEAYDGCHRGQSPFSTTTSERSDVMKLESEQNTSGDENETTTSSDIEILSAPNGDNGERHSSPLKHMWVPRTLRIRRSESPSSDCSKDSSMPVVREGEEIASKGTCFREMASQDSEADKHLEQYREKIKSADLDKLFQQQRELQSLLEVREKKVVELSKENVKLREAEEILQNQLQEMRRNLASDSHNLSNMTKELTRRLSQLEGEAEKVNSERDTLKKQLEEAQLEISKRITLTEVEETIREKDQQIKELLQEGEKLSKKELQHTTIIKKLRVKEEEMEHSIKSLKDKLDENSKEVDRLRRSMGAKDEQEKKHIDAIRQLTNVINKHEKELVSLRNSLEDSTAKEQGLKNSLDSTLNELSILRASCAAKDKEIQDLTLSVELAASEKLREGLDQAHKEASRDKEAFVIQIEDLRNSLKVSEEEANSRESALKDEISMLQLRLQESEAHNEELTKSISSATRPLVRQIENLQSSYNSQIASWEKMEKNLSDQLSDCQNQLSVSSEREKLATEKYVELSSKCNKLELQNSELRQQKSQISLQLQVLKSQLGVFEESKERDEMAMSNLRQSFASEIKQLKDEKERLGSELKNSLELLKEERQMVRTLQEELKNKENISPCPSPSASMKSSVESINNWGQDDVLERRLPTPVGNHRISVYDSLRIGCQTSVLENLQSQLKQREGEIAQLQCEITKLERERESLAQELVEVSTQNEGMQERMNKLESTEKLYKDVNQRYDTLLQMYGEKVEECEELKLDLSDVKTAYKVQIEELLSSKCID